MGAFFAIFEKTIKMSDLKHIPVIIGNGAPFRLVYRKGDLWQPSLQEINERTYDYVKLNRMSTYIDIGINPFSMGIGFDGSLILPAIDNFASREKALEKFNQTLGILLLGGVYSEAISPIEVSYGTLTLDGYVKFHGGSGLISNFHKSIRSKIVSSLDVIKLLSPQTITIEELEKAYFEGKNIFDKISNLSPGMLLNGTSKYVKHEWADSLIFLWTSIEQVINVLWTENLLKVKTDVVVEGRMDFLKDYRTWTSSNKIELLYQKNIIPIEVYKLLNKARKVRNDFIHNGKSLDEMSVTPALEGLFKLISIILSNYSDSSLLDSVIETIYSNKRGDLFPKRNTHDKEELSHWMPLPPLPGDKDWGDKPYEIIDDLMLRPLNNFS